MASYIVQRRIHTMSLRRGGGSWISTSVIPASSEMSIITSSLSSSRSILRKMMSHNHDVVRFPSTILLRCCSSSPILWISSMRFNNHASLFLYHCSPLWQSIAVAPATAAFFWTSSIKMSSSSSSSSSSSRRRIRRSSGRVIDEEVVNEDSSQSNQVGSSASSSIHDTNNNMSLQQFQSVANILLDKIEGALVKLKDCNDRLEIVRHSPTVKTSSATDDDDDDGDSTNDDVTFEQQHDGKLTISVQSSTDLYWGGGTYIVTIHSDGGRFVTLQSPLSGMYTYVYSIATQEWIGQDDGHSLLGMLTRDWIRQCNGVPDF